MNLHLLNQYSTPGLREWLEQHITPEMAAYVRQLRVDFGSSWRVVARKFAKAYPHAPKSDITNDVRGFQTDGMLICRIAAVHFNEDYWAAPWN